MRKLRHEEIPRVDPDALSGLPRHPVAVLVDNVRSIHNVGSMFRTSDAARVEHLYLAGITGTPENRRLHKSALGAQDTVPWSHHADAGAVADRLREKGYTLSVLEITDTPTSLSEVSLEAFPLCLIVGNEISGVSETLVEKADVAFEIDQFGSKQSLNVAVAYGIAVFSLVRRFRALRDGGL